MRKSPLVSPPLPSHTSHPTGKKTSAPTSTRSMPMTRLSTAQICSLSPSSRTLSWLVRSREGSLLVLRDLCPCRSCEVGLTAGPRYASGSCSLLSYSSHSRLALEYLEVCITGISEMKDVPCLAGPGTMTRRRVNSGNYGF